MHDRNHYLKRMSVGLLVAIMIVWLGVYQVIISGAFSRSFWANISGIQHSVTTKQSVLVKLTLNSNWE